MTEQIHQISRILAIMNSEVTVKSDLVRIFAQQSAADRMECPRPGQGINHQSRLFRQDLRGDLLNPADHLLRRSAGKGEEQDATRINAPNNQMGHAVGERLRLSRTCPCIDEQRLNTVLHGMALFRVERNEMRIGHRFGIVVYCHWLLQGISVHAVADEARRPVALSWFVPPTHRDDEPYLSYLVGSSRNFI